MFKKQIQKKLEKYVKAYFRAHSDVKLIVVSGSVGKTSTKAAIATLLSTRYRVRMQDGNHNTGMSAPLAILGIEYPENIRSIGSWLSVFRAARRRIKQPSDVDVIVQELGTDHPGDIELFASYLAPDIAVVTAVTPEHMEFFQTLDAVAREELGVINFSKIGIINRDDIDGQFAQLITNPSIDTYGTTAAAEYRFETQDFTLTDGFIGRVIAPEYPEPFEARINVVGEHSLRPAMAAVTVAAKLGLTPQDIVNGLAQIRSVPGRMNILKGLEESIIIDDTYNSSPAAAIAAVQTIYSIDAPQRIAILGSMNELGAISAEEHKRLGEFCDPSLLSWVITVGEEAEKYLAPAARARGCQVKSFRHALEAGGFAHGVLDQGAIVLVKGSQGGIYLEEAVKILLHETIEDRHLVRQSTAWLETKRQYFSDLS